MCSASPDATRELCNAWKASSVIREVVCSERLGSIACQLMGWTSCRMGQDDVLHKPPGGNAVGFHQDGAYISDNFLPRENNSLTLWISLDDVDEETGALQYAPGSHRWQTDAGLDFHSATSSFHGSNGDYLAPLRHAVHAAHLDDSSVALEDSLETISVSSGEMIVHHQSVWHGSGPNTSKTRQRRALVAHLLDGNVEWSCSANGTGGLPRYIYGRYYIRGESVPREDFFPVTYSIRRPGAEDNQEEEINGQRRRSMWLG